MDNKKAVAKNAFKDFIFFNTTGGFSPSSLEDYASKNTNSLNYSSPREGSISKLGKALSGVGAAFAGDTQWAQRQQKLDQEQYQADLEWKAALAKQQMDSENTKIAYTFDPVSGTYTAMQEVPKGSIVRNKALPIDYQVEKQQALESSKGIAPADIGKMQLAKESVTNLTDVDKILFPKGNLESFRRDVAGASNLPIIGGPAPFNKEAQQVYRKLGSSLAARQLIQTGVAANESERKQLANQFLANYGSDPAAFREGLGQLKDFYAGYQESYKTRGLKDNGNEDGFSKTKSGIKYRISQ